METRPTTILFAETSPEAQPSFLDTVKRGGGRQIKSIGNTHLYIFDNADAACSSALKVSKITPPVPFRIGIALGPVSRTETDAFGDTVNLAARLQGNAAQRQVLISDSVYEAIDRLRCPAHSIGSRQFKGISSPIPVFELDTGSLEKRAQSTQAEKPSKELFDFSRVDAERMQEEEALKPTTIELSKQQGDRSIALAKEQKEPVIRRPTRNRPREPQAPVYDGNATKRVELRKKALWIFGVFAVAIPGILLGGSWGLHWMVEKITYVSPSSIPDPRESEVVKSIERGKTNKHVVHTPDYGSIVLKTTPPGASVYVNDELVSDTTPVRLNKVSVKVPIRVRVVMYGYVDALQLFNLEPHEAKEIEIKLVKLR